VREAIRDLALAARRFPSLAARRLILKTTLSARWGEFYRRSRRPRRRLFAGASAPLKIRPMRRDCDAICIPVILGPIPQREKEREREREREKERKTKERTSKRMPAAISRVHQFPSSLLRRHDDDREGNDPRDRLIANPVPPSLPFRASAKHVSEMDYDGARCWIGGALIRWRSSTRIREARSAGDVARRETTTPSAELIAPVSSARV